MERQRGRTLDTWQGSQAGLDTGTTRAYDSGVVSQDRHTEDNRIERIGKKYQWIAYHELLARIADHYSTRLYT